MALTYLDLLQVNRLDELTTLLESGPSDAELKIYAGSAPPNVTTNISDQTLLVTLVASPNTALSAVQGNTSTASTLQFLPFTDATAAAGTATFFRLCASTGAAYCQGSCGTSGDGADLGFSNPVFALNDLIQIAATGDLTITAGND